MENDRECRKLLAVIPARAGSKGIPQKNIREFLGKPLITWTIESALQSGLFDRVVVTTDDEETARIAKACGAEAPFLRPGELAQDATPTAPVVLHAIEWLRSHENWVPDLVMVLEPTSPGRRPFHIREAVALLAESGADSVASVSEVPHHFVPPKVLTLERDGTMQGVSGTAIKEMIHRRQDLPKYYALNGILFACRTGCILQDPPSLWGNRVTGYVVDPRYSLDLDKPEDWTFAETRLQRILREERS